MDENTVWQRAVSVMAEEMAKGRLVLFVGSGCSCAAGLPSWSELLRLLIGKFDVKTKVTDPLRASGRLDREIGKLKVRETVVENLRTNPDLKTDLHRALVALPVNLFVTTNYDHLLENAFRQAGIEATVIVKDNDIPFLDPTRKTIVKLHGDVDSPSSMVFSPSDYRSYRKEHPAFVEWLAALGMQNCVLFVGSSFEDPRLIEMDDHVIGLFGSLRRSPVIVLKTPAKKDKQPVAEFDAENADFEDRKAELEERGFVVITVDSYEKVPQLLSQLHDKVLDGKKAEAGAIQNNAILLSLQSDRYEDLRGEFTRFLDADTKALIRSIKGGGSIPSLSRIRVPVEALVARLDRPPHDLSDETKVEAYLALCESFVPTGRTEDLRRAREFFAKANAALANLRDKQKWSERLGFTKARLLYLEGQPAEAIAILDQIPGPKSTTLRLAFLLGEGRPQEVLELVKRHEKTEREWIPFVLTALIETGQPQEAEDLFEKTKTDLVGTESRGLLEKLYFHIASAFLHRAHRLEGKPHVMNMLASPLSQEAQAACMKARYYAEGLFRSIDLIDLNESLIAALMKAVEMNAAFLTRDFAQADQAARQLLTYRPSLRDVAEHVAFRMDSFEKDELSKLVENLMHDHPEAFWAWRICALLEGFRPERREESWEAVTKAAAMASGEQERQDAAWMAVNLGHVLGRDDHAKEIADSLLDESSPVRKFLRAKTHLWNKEVDKADENLKELVGISLPPPIASEIRYMRANIHKERGDIGTARVLLEQSVKTLPNALNLKALISVCATQQDFSRLLAAVEEFEGIGGQDEECKQAKAQAAFNLGKFQLAEQTWRELSRHGRPMYALGLARTLMLIGKEEEALKNLQPYVQHGEELDLDCLWLAVKIHEGMEHYEAAFLLVDEHWKEIQDHPQLLGFHVELAYRAGREDRASKSIQRLLLLNKEDKLPEGFFGEITIEQMKVLFNNSRLKSKNANESYRVGRLPRLLLCKLSNMPSYLDWRVRTQKLRLSEHRSERIDYSTYVTNSFRVEKDRKKPVLKQILAPSRAKEIVIDIHSLITLHRLGLLPSLERRFKAVYYPIAMEWIFREEQVRYTHHQKSKEDAYRQIDYLLKTNQVQQLSAQEEPGESNVTRRSLLVTRLEGAPFIAAYEAPEELSSVSDAVVFRLQELVHWLYTSGKIREDQYRENLTILKGAPSPTHGDAEQALRRAQRLVLGPQSLEFLVERELLEAVTALGIQPIVESWTGRYFRNMVLELDFAKEVGQWQRDLIAFLEASKVFQSFDSPPPDNPGGLYFLACERPIQYAAEKELDLLTDDRMMQMVWEGVWGNRQFGTDALLTDLFEKDLLTIDQYARRFVQLCRWRYRFLVPDLRIMLHLAKQYKKRPLGEELQEIVDYGLESMEDPGLFLGEERTEPPFPIGVKYHFLWLDRWVEFLCHVWVDDDFSKETRVEITRKVFGFAFPPPPRDIREEIRRKFYALEDKKILAGILRFAIDKSKDSEKLHGLLCAAFDYYGYEEVNRIDAVYDYVSQCLDILQSDSFLETVSRRLKGKRKPSRNNMVKTIEKNTILSALLAYYGKRTFVAAPKHEQLLNRVGLGPAQVSKAIEEIEDERWEIQSTVGVAGDSENIDISEYQDPFLFVRPKKQERTLVGSPHELIKARLQNVREDTLRILCEDGKVTTLTKEYLGHNRRQIVSDVTSAWREASEQASKRILHDYRYARALFTETMLRHSERQDWLSDALDAVFFPNIESVTCDSPGVIQSDFPLHLLQQNRGSLIFEQGIDESRDTIPVIDALNRYLNGLGFVPFAPPYDAWSVVSERVGIYPRRGPRPTEILASTRSWVEQSDDPMAYLVAWEVCLGARQIAEGDDKAAFEGSGFRDLMNSLFFVLALPEFRSGNELENARRDFLAQLWATRRSLAEHYLGYLEIAASDWADERRVLTAWWMAKMTCDAFLRSMGARWDRDKVSSSFLFERTRLFKDEVQDWILERTGRFRIQHAFHVPSKPQSPHRFCTFHNYSLLAFAAMAFIMPKGEGQTQHSPGFRGMKDIVTNEIRSGMLKLMEAPEDVSLGQLPQEIGDSVRLLWHTPLSFSIPSFLRGYYGESLEFIGENHLRNIDWVEHVANPGFLDKALSEITQLPEEQFPFASALALEALHVHLATQGKLPENASVFRGNPNLLRRMVQSDAEMASICILSLFRILKLLVQWNEIEWARVFEKQLLPIEYDLYAKHAVPIVEGALFAVLVGVQYDLMTKILAAANRSKEFQRALWQIKRGLEHVLGSIPPAFREILRRLLRDLEAISEPE